MTVTTDQGHGQQGSGQQGPGQQGSGQPERLRVGLVGNGYWAVHTAGAGLVAHPGVELAGLWARDPDRAAAAARELGTSAVADYDELLAGVDAVAFAVPPFVQAPLATRAAGHGRHLLLDKPTALDPGEADELAAAVADGGVASAVFFTNLWDPARRAWADAARAAGDHDGAVGFFMGSIDAPGSPYAESPWRREHGALWDSLPHAVSLLEATLGPVEAVTARGGHRDTVHLLTAHPGGATGTVTASLLTPLDAGRQSFDVWGPRGIDTMPAARDTGAAYAAMVGDLLRQVAAGRPGGPLDAAYGAHVVRVLADAERQVDAARR